MPATASDSSTAPATASVSRPTSRRTWSRARTARSSPACASRSSPASTCRAGSACGSKTSSSRLRTAHSGSTTRAASCESWAEPLWLGGRGRPYLPLPADRLAVLSEVGSGPVHAVHRWIAGRLPFRRRVPGQPLEQDGLVAAEHVVVPRNTPHLEAQRPQLRADQGVQLRFEVDAVGVLAVMEAGRIAGGLHVHAEVDHVHDLGGLGLRLLVAAHVAEREERLFFFSFSLFAACCGGGGEGRA